MAIQFSIPELGENVEKGDVVRVLVKPGDVVKKDQPVLELETDKATIEVPSSVEGKITEVKVKTGDKVKVGQVVLTLEAADGAAASAPAKEKEQKGAAKAPAESAKPAAADAKPAPKSAEVVEFAARPAASRPESSPSRPEPAVARRSDGAAAAAQAAPAEPAASIPAAPSVRRYARELGVDLSQVSGSGPGGRIGQDDVTHFVKQTISGGFRGAVAAPALPDFSKWGEVEARPMSNIRRKTAEHLSVAWQAPHVTQHDRADVTALEEFRHAYGPRVEKAGGKLTVTAILVKLVAMALDRYPQFASSLDMARGAIIFKKYRHIGLAVDTPNGLLVPVIRDADRKTLTEIAVELGAISQKARDKKLTLDEMAGSVFSISNLGGIGGTAFTPIVNQPEVAILGVSRGATEPVWKGSQFVPREMLPLSLSYDHRVIDGADAARFLRFIAEALEQPLAVFL